MPNTWWNKARNLMRLKCFRHIGTVCERRIKSVLHCTRHTTEKELKSCGSQSGKACNRKHLDCSGFGFFSVFAQHSLTKSSDWKHCSVSYPWWFSVRMDSFAQCLFVFKWIFGRISLRLNAYDMICISRAYWVSLNSFGSATFRTARNRLRWKFNLIGTHEFTGKLANIWPKILRIQM